MAYIYRADVWCDECGEAIRARLTAEGKAPADPDDEWSYDSDDFPKRAGDDDESDCPQHCAANEDCINAIELPSGGKVGLLFGELTLDGVAYVQEAIEEAAADSCAWCKEVVALWQEHYRGKGYSL
jgi:hypothetical protein